MVTPGDYAEMVSRLAVNKPGLMTEEYFVVAVALFLLIDVASVVVAFRLLIPGGVSPPR